MPISTFLVLLYLSLLFFSLIPLSPHQSYHGNYSGPAQLGSNQADQLLKCDVQWNTAHWLVNGLNQAQPNMASANPKTSYWLPFLTVLPTFSQKNLTKQQKEKEKKQHTLIFFWSPFLSLLLSLREQHLWVMERVMEIKLSSQVEKGRIR